MGSGDRTILHVDMDAFFAAIAQRDDPALRGRPVLIGGDGPRSVVATASYEARPYGCRSAMPMAVAKRLCPQAVIVPVPGQKVRETSAAIFDIFDTFSPLVQPISVDEAFLDVTGSTRLLGDAVSIARRLKQRIADQLQLTASVGVAPNKFLAKLASDLEKPDGLTVITPENLDATLCPLPVQRIMGVGPSMLEKLHRLGVRTIADLRAAPRDLLQRRFGHEHADHLIDLAFGRDDRPVTGDRDAKSIGHEQTFGSDVELADEIRRIMLHQAEQVGRRLRKHRLLAGGMTVKIRYGDFETITRSAALDPSTDLTDDLWHAARKLFDAWATRSFRPVRLIGVTATRLSPADAAQSTLFVDPQRQRRQQLDRATDAIAARFGKHAIRRGGPDHTAQ